MTQQPGQTGCFRGFRLKSNFRAPMDLEVSWVLNFQACQASGSTQGGARDVTVKKIGSSLSTPDIWAEQT